MTPPPDPVTERDGRLDLRTRIAWLIGCMPELIKNVAWDVFVLFYYSQVIGLQGSLIGLALGLILIADALIDPYVGTLSDRLQRAPLGRRHTLMAAAVLPFAIGFAGVFAPPDGLSPVALTVWLAGFGLLARISISFYTVPGLAVGAELSRDPRERALIAMLRNIGNNLATLIVPVLAFQVFFAPTEQFPKGQLNPAPYASFGLTITALATLAMIIGIAGTRRRLRALEAREVETRAAAPGAGLWGTLRELVQAVRVTPNVRRLILLIFLVLVMLASVNQLTLHLSTYLWQLSAGHNQILLVANTLGTLAGVTAALALVRRYQHRSLMIFGLAGYLLLTLSAVAGPLMGLAPPAASNEIGWYVAACRFLGGLFYGCYLVPLGAAILDIADEHEVNTGRPQQGLVSGVHFLAIQAAGATVGILSGTFLDLIAFPKGLSPDQMPFDKVRALALFVCGIMIVGGGLVMLTIRRLELSAARQREITKQLRVLRTVSAAPVPASA